MRGRSTTGCCERGSRAWRVEEPGLLRDFASPYSPDCVEQEFCELRTTGILRSSRSPGPMPSGVLMYRQGPHGLAYIRGRYYLPEVLWSLRTRPSGPRPFGPERSPRECFQRYGVWGIRCPNRESRLSPSRGQLAPREGAGQLPALLLEIWARNPTNYLSLGGKGGALRAGWPGCSPPHSGTRAAIQGNARRHDNEEIVC
jgi:hypothetical protein